MDIYENPLSPRFMNTPYWASIHIDGRVIARARDASKSRDSVLNCFNRSEILEATRPYRCRVVCQISK